jgi:lambda family phage portal protein
MYAERAEQYRGVPLLAPVIEAIKQITRYIDAELVASVINGYFTAFVTSPLPNDGGPLGMAEGDFFEGDPDIPQEPQNPSNKDCKMGPGSINWLLPGEQVQIADPKRPSNNFDAFVTSMARYIGAAIDVPYEMLLKSFTASYSASRASLLEAWKGFKMRRTWFANDFCQPIYEIWLAEAVARGRINAPGFFNDPIIRKAWSHAEWNGPSMGQLNPLVEVQAAAEKINLGISTHEREAIELTGSDFDTNIETIIRENEKIKEANDILTPAPIPISQDNSQSNQENSQKGNDNS